MSRAQTGQAKTAREGFFLPIPVPVWVFAVLGAVGGGLTANPLLTAVSILLLPVLGSLLWRRGEPPVLLFACLMQWLQAVAGVFYADYQNISQHELFGVARMDEATWLSLAGVLVLALGIRLALLRKFGLVVADGDREIRSLSLPRAFMAWVAAFGVGIAASIVAWRYAGLAQIIYAFITFKWVFFFVLARRVVASDRGYWYLIIPVTVEFTIGLMGYFGSFKEVFFMLLIAVFSVRGRLGWRSRELVVATTCVVLVTSLVWTSVKMEYRAYLNQGTGEQKVTIPVAERIEKLGELLKDLNSVKLTDSIDDLVLRVSYTMYLALTLDYVPAMTPHERGQLWFDAIARVFMPRLFFPNKSSANDSLRAEKYTGVKVAGAEEGSSIGIGYMAESYIDFGYYGMFAPILLLGALFGLIYRYFTSNKRSPTLGTAMATAILFPAQQAFATSNLKIVGGTVTACLVMLAFNYFAAAQVIAWLKPAPQPGRSPRRNLRPIPRAKTPDLRPPTSDL